MEDKSSFLFTLANYTGATPTKIPQVDGGGIYDHSSYGPAFGTASGPSIIFMNGNQAYCNINPNVPGGFQFPPGQNIASFMWGSTGNVNISYLEVYGLQDSW